MATIFLYTDATSLDPETRSAMIEAGFLPVHVADLDAVRLINPEVTLPRDRLDKIGAAALAALCAHATNESKAAFTRYLAEALGCISK